MAEQVDMDAILDEALDELDDSDDDENDVSLESKDKENEHHFRLDVGTETPSKTIELQEAGEDSDEPESDRRASARAEGSPADVFQNMLRNFIEADEDGSDPDRRLDKFMDQVQSQLPPTEKEESPKHDTASPEDDDVKKTIAAIMEEMAKADIGDVSEEEMLKGMFQGLQDTGEDFNAESFNPDAVIDGMMEQLLSKDLMYTPMKQVTDKFPQWLEKNKDDLSVEEYQQRSKQYDCFKELVHVYETNPDNVADLLELMQQVQEYGQPPQDIINEIAPGLELDEDGMPKINPLEGMPFGGTDEECTIM